MINVVININVVIIIIVIIKIEVIIIIIDVIIITSRTSYLFAVCLRKWFDFPRPKQALFTETAKILTIFKNNISH